MTNQTFDQMAAELAAALEDLQKRWPEVFEPHTYGEPFVNRYFALDGGVWVASRDAYGLSRIWHEARYDYPSLRIYVDSGVEGSPAAPRRPRSVTYSNTTWRPLE